MAKVKPGEFDGASQERVLHLVTFDRSDDDSKYYFLLTDAEHFELAKRIVRGNGGVPEGMFDHAVINAAEGVVQFDTIVRFKGTGEIVPGDHVNTLEGFDEAAEAWSIPLGAPTPAAPRP